MTTDMTTDPSTRGASTLWILLLTIASTATTLALACATPFAALATLAALHMRRRDGIALIVASWFASQLVGFCVLNYPRDAKTFAWGAAIGIAAMAAVLAADATARALRNHSFALRLMVAYVAALVGFKGVIFVSSLALGGVGIALSPAMMADQFVRNGVILAVLLALYRVLVSLGVPPAPARVAA